MRHCKIGRLLNRKRSHRLAMMRNLSNSLIFYECIKTTLPKSKELRRFLEPLITLSKINNVFNRRLVFYKICNNFSVYKLFNKLGPKFLNRNGGYLSILKCGFRFGDNAPMSYIKFVN